MKNGQWIVDIENQSTKEISRISCKILVNAAGPWVQKNILRLNLETKFGLKLVKGSHIIVPKFYSGEQAYICKILINVLYLLFHFYNLI